MWEMSASLGLNGPVGLVRSGRLSCCRGEPRPTRPKKRTVKSERRKYQAAFREFDPLDLMKRLDGDLEDAINGCVECCDRHVGANEVALSWANSAGERGTRTFEDLQARSAQVANLLFQHGVRPGDRVAGLLPRIPELVETILGVFRLGAVYQPIFTAFGPKAIEQCLNASDARVVVTDSVNRPKLNDIASNPLVICVTADAPIGSDVGYAAAVDGQPDHFDPVMRQGNDALLMMSTSGTTGLPKGVQVPIRSLPAIMAYMEFGLDLQPDDVYWNIADPGWAYGLYYAVIGPLLAGHQTTLYDGPFSVRSTIDLIDEFGVTNLAGAPTAYRMIVADGDSNALPLAANLRVASSAGEPLSPETMRWFNEHVGCDLYDQYGQTEIGMVLANHHGLQHEVIAGSPGFALPGFRLDVVDDKGQPVPQGTEGTLAVHRFDSPLFFFDGYKGSEGQAWAGDYYLTGDTVEQNKNGSISFIGRSDDVISSAGFRIGPFDVESCLLEHDAVAESAAVGKPDKQLGEIVAAFVVLHPGKHGDDALRTELTQHVRNRLGTHAYPRELTFVDELPKTASGKIQRFYLRDGRTTRHLHRRPELLKAATNYVLDNGIAGLSLRPAAVALGVTHSTLLRHFESKDLLVAEVIKNICAELAERVTNPVGDLSIPTGQMLRSDWQHFSKPSERRKFLMLFELVALDAREPGRYGALADVLVEGLLAPIEKNLQHNGWDATEARELATAILAQARGLHLDLAITGDQQRVDRAMYRYIDMITASH